MSEKHRTKKTKNDYFHVGIFANQSLIRPGAPSGPQTSPNASQTSTLETKTSLFHILCKQEKCQNLTCSLSYSGCKRGGGYAAALGN